jgi:hypothetical protein
VSLTVEGYRSPGRDPAQDLSPCRCSSLFRFLTRSPIDAFFRELPLEGCDSAWVGREWKVAGIHVGERPAVSAQHVHRDLAVRAMVGAVLGLAALGSADELVTAQPAAQRGVRKESVGAVGMGPRRPRARDQLHREMVEPAVL